MSGIVTIIQFQDAPQVEQDDEPVIYPADPPQEFPFYTSKNLRWRFDPAERDIQDLHDIVNKQSEKMLPVFYDNDPVLRSSLPAGQSKPQVYIEYRNDRSPQ